MFIVFVISNSVIVYCNVFFFHIWLIVYNGKQDVSYCVALYYVLCIAVAICMYLLLYQ